MNILGIGPLEIALVLLLVLIIFNPKDIEKAGKSIGMGFNKLIRSDSWRIVQKTSQELKNIPARLIKKSGMEDLEKSVKSEMIITNTEINQSLNHEENK